MQIAIDTCLERLKMLQHNSALYGVAHRIDAVCADCRAVLPTWFTRVWFTRRLKADVVVLAPPWGGVNYSKKEVFRLEDLPAGLDGTALFAMARTVTRNVVMLLPRNVDRRQVAELGEEGEVVELVEGMVDGVVKMVIAYFGDLAASPQTLNMLMWRVC